MNPWLKGEKLSTDKPGPTGSRTLEPERLTAAVAANPNACLDELAESLDSKRSTVAHNLQKPGIARKKTRFTRIEIQQPVSAESGNP